MLQHFNRVSDVAEEGVWLVYHSKFGRHSRDDSIAFEAFVASANDIGANVTVAYPTESSFDILESDRFIADSALLQFVHAADLCRKLAGTLNSEAETVFTLECTLFTSSEKRQGSFQLDCNYVESGEAFKRALGSQLELMNHLVTNAAPFRDFLIRVQLAAKFPQIHIPCVFGAWHHHKGRPELLNQADESFEVSSPRPMQERGLHMMGVVLDANRDLLIAMLASDHAFAVGEDAAREFIADVISGGST